MGTSMILFKRHTEPIGCVWISGRYDFFKRPVRRPVAVHDDVSCAGNNSQKEARSVVHWLPCGGGGALCVRVRTSFSFIHSLIHSRTHLVIHRRVVTSSAGPPVTAYTCAMRPAMPLLHDEENAGVGRSCDDRM